MKFYCEKNNDKYEIYRYLITKFQRYMDRFLTLDKEKRKSRKIYYEHTFKSENKFMEKYNYAIPENKYYKPVGIFTTDIVEKNNIKELKKGLKKLLLKHKTHKFIGGFMSLDGVINNIDSIDDTFSSYYSSINCGRFDFVNNDKLNNIIDYFDIDIRNFNTSYLAIEVQIYISENTSTEIEKIINDDYKHKKGFVIESFTNSNKKSGGKKIKSICHYNNAHLKSEIINKKMIEIKWALFNELKRYIPFVLHNNEIMPPSVNIYNTNILPADKNTEDFFDSVGVNQYNGQFINKNEKLFFYTEIGSRNRMSTKPTDMIFLVNEELCEDCSGYYSFNFRTMSYFEEVYKLIYKCMIANILFDRFATICVNYKMKINGLKVERYNLNKLLKIRYRFENEITWFKRFANETDWEKEGEKVESVFDQKYKAPGYNLNYLVSTPVKGHEKLNKTVELIQEEIDQKLLIISHLDEYKKSKLNINMSLMMLLVSLATLLLIIYPDFASKIRWKITDVFNNSTNLLRTILKNLYFT